MTVAAVILVPSPSEALADADGTPAVRRIADAAWAGGASPVVVVADDPDGTLAAALATAEATLVAPGAPGTGVPGQAARGMSGAVSLVAGTTAALVWPVRHPWVDPETVTTLIAGHGGTDQTTVLVPVYRERAGVPALVPVTALPALRSLSPGRPPEALAAGLAEAGLPLAALTTGDPGVTLGISVARSALPPFDGPPRPDDGVDRDWGAPAADQADDLAPPGPARLDTVR